MEGWRGGEGEVAAGGAAGEEGGIGMGMGRSGRGTAWGGRGTQLLPSDPGARCLSGSLLAAGVALTLAGMGLVATAPIAGDLDASAKAMNEAVDAWNASPAVDRFRRAAVRVGYEGFVPDAAYQMPLSPDWMRDDVMEESEWAKESLGTYQPHKFATEAVGLLGPDRDRLGANVDHWEAPYRAVLYVSDGGVGEGAQWTEVDLGYLTPMEHTVQRATSWKNCRNVLGGNLDARGCHTYHALNALCVQLRWDDDTSRWMLDRSDALREGRCFTGQEETVRLTPPTTGAPPTVPPERMVGVGRITVRLSSDPWLVAVGLTDGHPETFAEQSKERYATGIILMLVGIVGMMPVLFGAAFRIWFGGEKDVTSARSGRLRA